MRGVGAHTGRVHDLTEIDRVDAAGTLTAAYRSIRRVSPPESPFSGMLATVGLGAADAAGRDDAAAAAGDNTTGDKADVGEEATVVLVDAARLEQWAGWKTGECQHVVGPLDLARRARGHDVVLPWCLERVEAFLARRMAASAPLLAGEIVTIAVSVLRGAAEVWSANPHAQPGPSGSWWLTDEGRPVFVHTTGDEQPPVEAGARQVIEALSADCDDRTVLRLLERAAALCETPRQLPRAIDDCERHFFAAAAPRPLATTVFPAALVRDIDLPSLRPAHDTPPGAGRLGHLRDAIARHVDADLGDMVAVRVGEALRGVRGRLSRGHRLPWLAAGAVAALIVVGGALWPSGEPAETAAAEVSAASPPPPAIEPTRGGVARQPTPTEAPARPAPGGPVPDEPVPDEPVPGEQATGTPEIVLAAHTLLDSLGVCRAAGDQAGCMTAITETPGLDPRPGVVDLAQPERLVTLVDDYGGAGLVQVSAADGTGAAQLVVIVKREDKWLLRDVYDVAKQPNG